MSEKKVPAKPAKNDAAVALGRAGGKARAKVLSPEERKKIASLAAISRWTKYETKK